MRPLCEFRRWLAAVALWSAVAAGMGAEGEPVAHLADQRINESSGLTCSLRHPGVLWTLNDSGGEPCVFAIDEQGRTRAKVRLPNCMNFDWEDLGSGPGHDGKPALFVADIGDNLLLRPVVQVFEIPEPDLRDGDSAEPRVWNGVYPDGAHNAECLLVDPADGALSILTKSEDGKSGLYAFPAEFQPTAMRLKQVGGLTLAPGGRAGKRPVDDCMTTGAAFAPDRSRIVISTYCHLLEWQVRPGEDAATVLRREPRRLLPPLTPQMEAVCYGPDSRTLWFTSERLPTPLYRLKPVAAE